MENRRILAINPGSTSTKIAVYQGDKSVFLKNIKHSNEELAQFNSISEQFEFRKDIILKELVDAEILIDLIEAVVGRGGLVKPIESGVYLVDEKLKADLRVGVLGEHASNLGGLIADNIAQSLPNAKAYIADPVVVDEMIDVARVSGHPEFERMSIFHALNQKAVSRSFALSVDKNYEDLNIIVAHLGGGISVGAHLKGRVIDVNNALDGEGPFSPERSGTLPAGALAKLCFSGDVTLDEVKKMIKGEGGLVAHMGTNDAYEIELKAKDGDAKAKLIQDAMAYQVGKSIGACAAALKGKVDGIILTGGIAHNGDLVSYVKEMVSFIAPVVVYPGEDEMKALAMNGYMVLRGDVEPKRYV
ncbi:butyrate kinase [Ancylomarina euxinus]|uniref:Probable butyrate kinase n=1 Tax=Ancylomarina euxinus TaxID=2283627 RepID=A0A425XYI1_9BACT|nr:butyrate kinase [Ancylomarina euxinus]MCZ4695725.1 butyrate kinase [Ancylomarina euxinus]MUP16178.1 butyrate kinase [Ancylomarina euxinus]RRG20039.1 butyrate kinase [Ancylomarina euxinus]